MAKIHPVVTLSSHLGESPMWDGNEGFLWWIDIYKPTLNRFHPESGRNEAITLNQNIHAIAVRESGGIVGSFEHGIGFLDPDVATITIATDPIGDAEARFNDGKCDCMGRFWTGSMSNDWVTPVGCLFRFDADRTVRTMDSGFNLSNGMGWSPDNATMYFTDFGQSTIFAYDYDAQTGDIANRRPFVVIPEDKGRPDGMTVDADGCLWVALWDGWAVAQFNPAGKCIDRIPMPVKRPTSCMFGGPDLSIMYVTSATMMLTDAELADQPLAGALFVVETGARGRVEPVFGG